MIAFIILNVIEIVSLITIDVMIIANGDENDSTLKILTYAFTALFYFIILCVMVYVSIRIFFIDIKSLPSNHPSPKRMGISMSVATFSVLSRFGYDFISAINGNSIMLNMCDEYDGIVHYNKLPICKNDMFITITSVVIEIFLMSLWEIVPLICFIVMFWKIPKKKTFVPFAHLKEDYYDIDVVNDNDSSDSSLYPNYEQFE